MRQNNTGRSKPVPLAWQPLIAGYLRHLRALGRPSTTVNSRREQIEGMARALNSIKPADVTRGDIIGYHADQTWARETRRTHRNAAVSFFTWAFTTERLSGVNPVDGLPTV
ncbi:hypothetical protein AAFP35_16865 [Gordonia sp. CPCC 206044]|uniref:hypothetical protein n=1 Tax=Gordonia sp. CPCC 206044 TaxID=3140793 RepID=UPI003AF3C842